MNIYYNVITGMQYTGGEDLFQIDISVIPEMDIAAFIEQWKQTSYLWVNKGEPLYPVEIINRITEYNL